MFLSVARAYSCNMLIQIQYFAKKLFIQQKTRIDMSDQELNAYRLTSMEEPTDEMLHAIMREAAEEATASTNKALVDYFKEISAMMQRRIAVL